MSENLIVETTPTPDAKNSVNSGLFTHINIIISKLPAIPVIASVVLLIVVIPLIFLILSNQNSKVAHLNDSASNAANNGDYEKAKSLYAEVLKSDKKNVEALAGIINTNSLIGNQNGNELKSLDQSKMYINDALKYGADNANTLTSVGYAYETAGDYEKAKSYYDKSIKIDPESSDSWFHLGHTLQFLGKSSDSKKAYDKAYSLNPNNPQIMMVRANSLFSEGKAQESFDLFMKAASQPDLNTQTKAEALSAAAVVRMNQGSFEYSEDAVKVAKQAMKADPNFSPALSAYAMGLMLIDTSNSEWAIYYLTKAVMANPRISKNYYNLAHVYTVTRDYKQAISQMQYATETVDNDNTIFDKKLTKAAYTYELAKIDSLAGVDAFPSIVSAIQLNPNLKTTIKNDIEKGGLFTELSGNSQLKLIINR